MSRHKGRERPEPATIKALQDLRGRIRNNDGNPNNDSSLSYRHRIDERINELGRILDDFLRMHIDAQYTSMADSIPPLDASKLFEDGVGFIPSIPSVTFPPPGPTRITDHVFCGELYLSTPGDSVQLCTDENEHGRCLKQAQDHSRVCAGVLNIKGEHFDCEMPGPHKGWAHCNQAAQAIWADAGVEIQVPKEPSRIDYDTQETLSRYWGDTSVEARQKAERERHERWLNSPH